MCIHTYTMHAHVYTHTHIMHYTHMYLCITCIFVGMCIYLCICLPVFSTLPAERVKKQKHSSSNEQYNAQIVGYDRESIHVVALESKEELKKEGRECRRDTGANLKGLLLPKPETFDP